MNEKLILDEQLKIINYPKYIADPIENYEFAALLIGINPYLFYYSHDPLQWLNDVNRSAVRTVADNPFQLEEYKPFETIYYEMLHSLNQRFSGKNDFFKLLESCLEKGYPVVDFTNDHEELNEAAKKIFLNLCLNDPKRYKKNHPNLTRLWQPEHTDAKIYGINLCDYPEQLQVAIKIYADHWHDLPANMCTPSQEYIYEQIDKLSKSNLVKEHIYKISKPKGITERRSEKYDEYQSKPDRSGN